MNVYIVQMRNTNNNYNWDNLLAFENEKNANEYKKDISREYHSGKQYRVEKLYIIKD